MGKHAKKSKAQRPVTYQHTVVMVRLGGKGLPQEGIRREVVDSLAQLMNVAFHLKLDVVRVPA